jgi:3-dehydroquinate dehydratase/shikimate dehydrogenase
MNENKICVVIKGPSYEEAYHQISKTSAVADIVELRLDYFNNWNLLALKNLKNSFSIPMIFTLRDHSQGGRYCRDENSRLQLIRQCAELEPEYLDIEYHVDPDFIKNISQEHPKIKLIVSYHNFTTTPDDLDALYDSLKISPASLYKIAVTAENTLQALELLLWTKKNSDKNLITISMGSYGQVTRILGPIFGNKFTYACLDESEATAPGQLTTYELRDRFHYYSLNPSTSIYGLIGDPVDQSLSHISHNALFQSCSIDAIYVKMQVHPHEVEDFLKLARQISFKGISVTMPLKEVVMKYLDIIDSQAKAIGAVNTLHFENGEIHGYNTDSLGAVNALEKMFPVKDKSILILGAGGAAKAIAYEASKRGARLTIANRDIHKAQALAKNLNCKAVALEMIDHKIQYDALINCTPLTQPINPEYLDNVKVLMDIKTKAINTPFIQQAKERKCKIVYGYKMFIEQAIGQYSLWLKEKIPVEKARQVLESSVRANLGI